MSASPRLMASSDEVSLTRSELTDMSEADNAVSASVVKRGCGECGGGSKSVGGRAGGSCGTC